MRFTIPTAALLVACALILDGTFAMEHSKEEEHMDVKDVHLDGSGLGGSAFEQAPKGGPAPIALPNTFDARYTRQITKQALRDLGAHTEHGDAFQRAFNAKLQQEALVDHKDPEIVAFRIEVMQAKAQLKFEAYPLIAGDYDYHNRYYWQWSKQCIPEDRRRIAIADVLRRYLKEAINESKVYLFNTIGTEARRLIRAEEKVFYIRLVWKMLYGKNAANKAALLNNYLGETKFNQLAAEEHMKADSLLAKIKLDIKNQLTAFDGIIGPKIAAARATKKDASIWKSRGKMGLKAAAVNVAIFEARLGQELADLEAFADDNIQNRYCVQRAPKGYVDRFKNIFRKKPNAFPSSSSSVVSPSSSSSSSSSSSMPKQVKSKGWFDGLPKLSIPNPFKKDKPFPMK